LDDPGFDHTVLAGFRARVAEAGLEQVALDALLARLAAEGLVKAGGRQRTDSTHVVAAVAALNRLELAGESVQAAHGPSTPARRAWSAWKKGARSRERHRCERSRRERCGLPAPTIGTHSWYHTGPALPCVRRSCAGPGRRRCSWRAGRPATGDLRNS